ncbi:MAG: Rieske 2Fe-2S domain-containing protein [Deltaproteobacteria bacterium]|nr:Rieske 2Fe-2S domain-containing protein [Deltaproteobacteria bacterium]
MLSKEENERLTRVGPGTPMGEVLRRYWYPIASTGELDARPTKEVKVMGEELVLYKDQSGTMGLIDRYCAHRRTNLAYGVPEKQGLRCCFHGWLFDETGRCRQRPYEYTVGSKQRVQIKAYPVQEAGGLIFAYLGPDPAPELPRWRHLMRENTVREAALAVLPCNWLQTVEGNIDPVHLEWLHAYTPKQLRDVQGYPARGARPFKHTKVGFDMFEYGIIKRRTMEGTTEKDEPWTAGHPMIMPGVLFQGTKIMAGFQYRVPMDDVTTLVLQLAIYCPPPGYQAPRQDNVPAYEATLYDEDGRLTMRTINSQDLTAWVAQGPNVDREKEILGESDQGIIMWRNMLAEQIKIVENGGDPLGVIRDPEKARNIELPVEWEGGTSGARMDPRTLRPHGPALQPKDGSRGPAAREADKITEMWREYLTQEEAARATA